MSSEVRSTIGATVAGCMIAVGLSAVLGFQTFLYFQIFPSDVVKYKLLVAWTWAMDAAHTILICTTVWQYTIQHFGDPDGVRQIVPALSIAVAVTAVTTLTVNLFYGWRIHKLSKQNWWLTAPIVLLCIARVVLAFTTTAEMIMTKTFAAYGAQFGNLLTAGLIVSAVTDVLVSSARYYYLRNLKQGYTDAVVVFTINDGCLTCAVVLATIGCWLGMPDNLIWLGIYFTIAKFYSNSLLATLNLRNWHRHRYAWPAPMSIPMTRPQGNNGLSSNNGPHSILTGSAVGDPSAKRSQSDDIHGMPARMEVFVDHQVEYNVGDFPRGDPDDTRSSRKSKNVA
ncbi:hypothetical protein DFH09DRAFT_1387483 [Mycena vulgaris]|nr:hypothetical protein DFH09DRAFT_1387483 [Mycena vulgaris]